MRRSVTSAIFFLLLATFVHSQNILERLKKEDANGDGKITREEFKGPSEIFKRFDANGDGVIDTEEMARVGGGRPGAERISTGNTNFEVIKDLAYGPTSQAQKLDLIRSKIRPTGSAPLILFIHGGGWREGDKGSFPPALEKLTAEGFVCATVNYRLSGEAKFPAAIEDCKSALRFLRSKAAEYGIDTNRVGVWGSSAGGHLAALMGTSGDVADFKKNGVHTGLSDRVQAVVDFFGPSDFLKMKGQPSSFDHMAANSPESEFLGGAVESMVETAKQASPMTYVGADDPPFLIMHGDKDKVVPINQSELFFKTLQDAKVPSHFVVVTNGGHGFRGPEIDREVLAFFKETLASKNAPQKTVPKKATGNSGPPKGIFVSGPPASSRSASLVPALMDKEYVDGFLLRVGWDDLEPSRGRFDWTLLDREMEAAKKCGKKVALGIVNGPHAPRWLADTGVPIVEIFARGRTSRIPLPWDPTYLSAWTNFVANLGARVQGHPNLVLVHITTATLNGFEMPLAFTPDEEKIWKEKGFDSEKWLASWKTVIRSFADAFPTTPLDVEIHPVFKDDALPKAVVNFGSENVPGRFGVFGAWWSDKNTRVYSGVFGILQDSAKRSFASVQMVASQTPNRFGPAGGLGEGGLAKAFDTGLSSGIRYFEVWETDLQNAELESFFVSMRKKCWE